MTAELGISERRACRALGQHRSTQRKIPTTPDDEAALTADIIELARQYGRYGYRRITALLRSAGWTVNKKRVERIWRCEGLKVPAKQPKRGRLWLNDGSCIRLRPQRPNHVWSYDFVADRTHDGKAFRMLCIIDEFTRESLAIRVARKLKATDVIEALCDLFVSRGVPSTHSFRQWPGVRRRCSSRMDRRRRSQDRLHRTWKPVGERLLRKLQRQAARRTAQRRDLLHIEGGADRDRNLAAALQQGASTLVAGIPTAGTRGTRLAGKARGANASSKLTFQTDHSVGAGQRLEYPGIRI